MVIGEGMWPTLVGIAIGAVAALGSGKPSDGRRDSGLSESLTRLFLGRARRITRGFCRARRVEVLQVLGHEHLLPSVRHFCFIGARDASVDTPAARMFIDAIEE